MATPRPWSVVSPRSFCSRPRPLMTSKGFFDTDLRASDRRSRFRLQSDGDKCFPSQDSFSSGTGDFSAQILALPADTAGPTLLFDLVNAGQSHLPQNPVCHIVRDPDHRNRSPDSKGSGFSGLPTYRGHWPEPSGPAVGMDPATLAAIGQMGNIWSGGELSLPGHHLSRLQVSPECQSSISPVNASCR